MDWDLIAGNEKVRFCPDCGKNVHNVSALKRHEAAVLVAEDGSVPCLSGICAPDGSLMSIGQLAAWSRRRFTQTVIATVPFAGFAGAQTPGGTLRGVVSDHIGTLLEGCDVVLTGADGTTFSVKSKAAGVIEFTAVPEGIWGIRAVMPGFMAFEQTGVAIRDGAETRVSIHLDIGKVGGGAADVMPKSIKRKLVEKLNLHK